MLENRNGDGRGGKTLCLCILSSVVVRTVVELEWGREGCQAKHKRVSHERLINRSTNDETLVIFEVQTCRAKLYTLPLLLLFVWSLLQVLAAFA
jgi:hypothetical protein